MRLRYDEVTLDKISDLIRNGKSNDDICKEFGVINGYSSLCQRCNKIRRELNIPEVKAKKEPECLDTKKEVESIKVSGLTKVGSVPKDEPKKDNKSSNIVAQEIVPRKPAKPVVGVSSDTAKFKSTPAGVVDGNYNSEDSKDCASLSDVISYCKHDVDELHNCIKRRFTDGFSDKELKELDTYSSGIKDIVSKLEDIQFLFDNIKVVRKGN